MAIGDKEVWSRDTSQDIQENVGLVNDLDPFTGLRRVRTPVVRVEARHMSEPPLKMLVPPLI
jgi:hypothetical protein